MPGACLNSSPIMWFRNCIFKCRISGRTRTETSQDGFPRAKRSPSARPLRQFTQLWPARAGDQATSAPLSARASASRLVAGQKPLQGSAIQVPAQRRRILGPEPSARSDSPPGEGVAPVHVRREQEGPDWVTTFWNRSGHSQASWALSSPPRLAPQAVRRPSHGPGLRPPAALPSAGTSVDRIEGVLLGALSWGARKPGGRARFRPASSRRSITWGTRPQPK